MVLAQEELQLNGKVHTQEKYGRRHLEAADKEELLVVRVQVMNTHRPLLRDKSNMVHPFIDS